MLYKIVVLFLYCASSAVAQLPSQDILALLQFKKGIKHDPTGYVMNSWNEESIDFNGCPSSWNGIVCNGGNVAGVVLDNLSISAEADLSVFTNLTMLVKLSMANNSISGEIPDNIGDMSQLEFLDLSNNLFSSFLPSGVGNLKNLKNLSLAGNKLSGSIPDSLTKLPNLVYLNLSSNGFIKNVPKGFELMMNLKVLDLHGNSLDGDLDAQLLLLSNATYVDLSWNLLSSSDSQKEKFLPGISETIKYLDLSHNQLSGSLINSGDLQIFQNLKVLDLSYNQFSGELPGFGFVYDLDILRLSNNRFSGLLPSVLLKGDAGVLSELDLSGNNLSGPIPLITSTTLHVLNLSSNSLTGELPLLSGDLTVLDLSNNLFDGNLTRIIKWANLEFLDLSHNHLSGIIPEETPQFVRLNHLNLSRNSFTGPLPRILTQYPKLSVLDLSFNQLDGPVLPELLTLPTMQQLLLRNNSLNGRINLSVPSSPGPSLKVLDLSQNQLDGYFPDNIGSLLGLQVLNLGSNKLSGSLPNSLANLTLLSSFDISENSFTGEIPSNLSTTLQSFNASYNDLSGTVPENLRNFPRLSFFPGNKDLSFPNAAPDTSSKKSPSKKLFKAVIAIACVLAVMILALLAVFLCYIRKRRQTEHVSAASRTGGGTGRALVVSAEDLMASRKESSSEGISNSPDIEKPKPVSGISPSKNSRTSWSPKSGDSNSAAENLGRLDVRSPDMLVGELHFLDDTISLNPEDLSRAPAEVLGRSSHGTSYRATLENGVFLTVKWLREGVAKQKKEFIKEAKKFASIRHPNLVCLRGYYWGPTQHEKLLLMDYISPGSLASFLYDRPGRKGPLLTWPQRLKIAVDVARGLNYLHFDRTIPHGNLKASNVLLEGPHLNARVSDYALHRLMTQSGTIEQILDSAILGYRAPELANLKKPLPSFKADVYAFGVILIEILTGRSAGDVIADDAAGAELADWVRRKVAEGKGSECFDAELGEELGNEVTDKAMKEVLGIGLRCIRSVSERPGIRTVYEDLSSV